MNPIVRVARLAHGADLPLPSYESSGAAGMDLRAAVEGPVVLLPGERAAIPTGLTLALPQGYEGQVRPRSGFALRDGVTALNSPGTIDADYRGEVKIILINHGARTVTIARGDRIAQLVVAPVVQAVWSEVGSLDETGRGEGGFGSTGTQ
jgi:dUTP pyrophosphatase